MTLEIDWSYFLELELWDLEDAICIAYRLHPSDFSDVPGAYADGVYPRPIEGRDPSLGDKITRRYGIALSAIEAGTLPVVWSKFNKPKVSPQEFATWASKKGWSLPEELRSLVPATQRNAPSLDNPKHKSTWLKLLGALCMKAGIDYTQPGADKKLETLTERYDIRVERKTIKSIIDDLSDHVEWRDAPPS